MAVKQPNPQKKHYNEFEAADYLGLAVTTLRDWRFQRTGPTFAKFGKKSVRYPVAELEKFAEQSRVTMAA